MLYGRTYTCIYVILKVGISRQTNNTHINTPAKLLKKKEICTQDKRCALNIRDLRIKDLGRNFLDEHFCCKTYDKLGS